MVTVFAYECKQQRCQEDKSKQDDQDRDEDMNENEDKDQDTDEDEETSQDEGDGEELTSEPLAKPNTSELIDKRKNRIGLNRRASEIGICLASGMTDKQADTSATCAFGKQYELDWHPGHQAHRFTSGRRRRRRRKDTEVS